MGGVGYEPTILVSEREKTVHVLHRAVGHCDRQSVCRVSIEANGCLCINVSDIVIEFA
jgi:hypothetical protein